MVDKYDEVLWRLRALYGLKNAKGTKMLAIGGLAAYSEAAQKFGPICAKEVWDYQYEIVSEEDFAKRLARGTGGPAGGGSRGTADRGTAWPSRTSPS